MRITGAGQRRSNGTEAQSHVQCMRYVRRHHQRLNIFVTPSASSINWWSSKRITLDFMIAPAGAFGFGPLRFVTVINKTPSLIRHVPANVFVSGLSFHNLKYENVPSREIVIVLVKVAVPLVLVPSRFQMPGIFFVSLASRPQPVSRKISAKKTGMHFIHNTSTMLVTDTHA